MDRASDSGSEGWGFESLPVYQRRIIRTTFAGSDYFYTLIDSNNPMQVSSGHLLDSGWTESTPYDVPPAHQQRVPSGDCLLTNPKIRCILFPTK